MPSTWQTRRSSLSRSGTFQRWPKRASRGWQLAVVPVEDRFDVRGTFVNAGAGGAVAQKLHAKQVVEPRSAASTSGSFYPGGSCGGLRRLGTLQVAPRTAPAAFVSAPARWSGRRSHLAPGSPDAARQLCGAVYTVRPPRPGSRHLGVARGVASCGGIDQPGRHRTWAASPTGSVPLPPSRWTGPKWVNYPRYLWPTSGPNAPLRASLHTKENLATRAPGASKDIEQVAGQGHAYTAKRALAVARNSLWEGVVADPVHVCEACRVAEPDRELPFGGTG